MEKCPICDKSTITVTLDHYNQTNEITCDICKEYILAIDSFTEIGRLSVEEKQILSGVIRYSFERKNNLTITVDNIKSLLKLPFIPNSIFDSFDLILNYIELKSSHAGEFYPFKLMKDYPIGFAQNENEFMRQLHIMTDELQWIEHDGGAGEQISYQMKAKGWERLFDLKNKIIDSKQIFVAMDFKDEMKFLTGIWKEGFCSALEETNYKPFRVDKKEHNNKIDDEIIAGIKSSICVVADFTYNNAGVYYEAGFAKGLDRIVIWTCQKEFFNTKGLHFDTNHYNHILWDNAEDLKNQLINRIRATLPIIA